MTYSFLFSLSLSLFLFVVGPLSTAGVEHVSVNHSHLEGFDNTGNIRIWPSEEVLAFYCAERCEQFAQKRVLELAAGMSGLAGLVVAALGEPSRVVITDGNEQSSKHLAENVKLNTHLSPKVPIESGCLLWGKERRRVHERLGRFDVVIAADCLFLTEYHQHLLESLDLLLDAGGYALLVGPTRGGSQGLFVERARSHGPFEVELHAEIHPRVRTLVQQQLHACVDPEERDTMNDKLTPRLVVIRRRNNHDASH